MYHLLKLLFLTTIGISISLDIKAQAQLGNEWLKSDRDYFKFSVSSEGVYRIDHQTLADAGFSLSTIVGAQIELFNMGNPISIRVSTSGTLSEDDFVEFYATANDGTLDARMFEFPNEHQLNPYKSLYDQDRTYFLTWSDEASEQQYLMHSNGLDNGGLPLLEEYYIHYERIVYDEAVNKPSHDGANQIRYSSMDIGEGYGSRPSNFSKIEIPVSQVSPIGLDPKLQIRFGTNAWSQEWEILKDEELIETITRGDISLVHHEHSFELEEIQGDNVEIQIKGVDDPRERHAVGYVELSYPRSFQFENENFISYAQHASVIPRYLEYQNFAGDHPILYNISEGYYMFPEREGNIIKTVIPEALEEEQWVLVDQETGIKSVENISAVVPLQQITKTDYLIISQGELIASNAVQAYADYRASGAGGGFDVTIVDVDQLYDTYVYGNYGHPLAIKNFINDLRTRDLAPDFVFIIGKGYEYPELSKVAIDPYVPTFGYPGSDNLMFAAEGSVYPGMAIGRLAVTEASEIYNYLDKIKLQEQAQDPIQEVTAQSWKKKILHMSGGNASDRDVLFRFLNNMGEVIENNTFGADVRTFRKVSADPLETIEAEDIIEEIDDGVTLLTFFGHSAVGTFDFSLENPSAYSNQGKNPIILSLGCHSGNIHTLSQGISEEFVLEPETGGIAFIASSGTAYPEPQYATGLHLYDLLGEQMYGGRLGQILQTALEERGNSELRSEQTLAQQITLHGDPAFKYQVFEGPDYIIDEASIRVNPGLINVNSDYISLEFDVLNLGKMVDEALDIRLIHKLPDGNSYDTIIHTVLAPGYREVVQIELNNPGLVGVGANSILIDIDVNNDIPEAPSDLAEMNNSYQNEFGKEGVSFFIFDQSAKPSYPSNYGIVGDEDLRLEATLSNGLLTSGTYVFQIDTTEHFNSPSLVEAVVEATSSIISWEPDVIWNNETVYYWRLAPQDALESLQSASWQNSSFVYVEGLEDGWNQSHYFQIEDANYETIELNPDTRQMEFATRTWDVRVKNEIKDDSDFWVFVNNTPWRSLNPRGIAPALSIFIWDPVTTLFQNKGTDYGSLEYDRDGFLYKMDSSDDRLNITRLLEAVRPGSRVFIHTLLSDDESDLHVDEWMDDVNVLGYTLFDILESYGATKVRGLIEKGTVPYTFVFDKGEGVVFEDLANSVYETLDLTSKAKTIWHRGKVVSELIGPATDWKELSWSEEIVLNDETKLNVYGVNTSGDEVFLKKLARDYNYNLEDIDAEQYPYLRLEYESEDFTARTSAQLKSWRVSYSKLPDAAMTADEKAQPLADTIDAGVPLDLNYQIHNLGDERMKPIRVSYTFLGENGDQKKFTKGSGWHIPSGHAQDISHTIPTTGLSGHYQLIIELNSDQGIKEITDCNNFGYQEIYIKEDNNNPFLNVTFDRRRINDGDRVKSRPQIKITLEDPQSNSLLDQPEDFDITLYYPGFFVWNVDTSSKDAEWIPATDLEDNLATMLLTPNLNEYGTYRLEVEARDRSGNVNAYDVTFEVGKKIAGESIPVFVYPNPSTDFVFFDFDPTGEKTPEQVTLQVYNSMGQVVHQYQSHSNDNLKSNTESFYKWEGPKAQETDIYYYQVASIVDGIPDISKGSVVVVR